MRILIGSLNAKYVHTNLAIRYLDQAVRTLGRHEVEVRDFTINQPLDQVVHEILRLKPDWIALSVYIWNRDLTLRLIRKLKRINPDWTLIVGGPEVSFDPGAFMEAHPEIDYLFSGESETAFTALAAGQDLSGIRGLSYREEDVVRVNPPAALEDVDALPFPYDDPIDTERLLYYETSRGCPYQCAYCMSSTIRGVRFRSLERVKEDLKRFIEAGARIVKFVDRTFNVDKQRSFEILEFLMREDRGTTTFHMELSPHLLDAEWIACLEKARDGLFQFEIGIQSTNPRVIEAIDRKIHFGAYRDSLKAFLGLKNCHTHVDLIAGLPYEDLESFYRSFDQVHALGADHFQLGFLKLLRGSPLRARADRYGYAFDPAPPYEVIRHDLMDYEELDGIKVVESLLETYDNSHLFERSLGYVMRHAEAPSAFYRAFAAFWERQGLFQRKLGMIERFEWLESFASEQYALDREVLRELMKFDYHRKSRYRKTAFFGDLVSGIDRGRIHDYLRDPVNIRRDLPQFEGRGVKEILKHLQVIAFRVDPTVDDPVPGDTLMYFDYLHDQYGKIRMEDNDE